MYEIKEKWKLIYCVNIKISDFAISNYGRLMNITSGELISQRCDAKGYKIVTLYIGHTKQYRVHKLVAMHFIPNPENKPFVNHINGNKQDNCVLNLEWCTAKENMRHAVDTGLHPTLTLEKYPHATHTNEEIRKACEFMMDNPEFKLKDISLIFNISYATLQNLKLHRSWKEISSQYNFKVKKKKAHIKIRKDINGMILSGYDRNYIIKNYKVKSISKEELANIIDEGYKKLKEIGYL